MAHWTQEEILKLIGAYRARNFLWDNTTQDYTDRNKRINAWQDIANEVGCDVMTVERKLKSLKTHFMAVHKAHTKRRIKAGLNSGSVAIPKWFAYEALTFLVKGRAPRQNRDSLNIAKQERAQSTIWRAQEIPSCRDEFTVFAEHVAIRLRNIENGRARLVAQHQINNILFEAEMGKYIHPYDSELVEGLDEPTTSNDTKIMTGIL